MKILFMYMVSILSVASIAFAQESSHVITDKSDSEKFIIFDAQKKQEGTGSGKFASGTKYIQMLPKADGQYWTEIKSTCLKFDLSSHVTVDHYWMIPGFPESLDSIVKLGKEYREAKGAEKEAKRKALITAWRKMEEEGFSSNLGRSRGATRGCRSRRA